MNTSRCAFLKSTVMFACLACLLMIAAAPSAYALSFVDWVFANQPDAITGYNPDFQYTFNSGRGGNNIQPNGKGSYYIYFDGLAIGTVNSVDDVQVSAVNTSGWCISNGWGINNEKLRITVLCYDAKGAPANASFTMLYQFRNAPLGDTSHGVAFVLADQLAQANSYTPSMYNSFNSTGGTNTVKDNPGHGATSDGSTNYTATLPGLTKFGGDIQVTPVYFRARCKPVSWDVVSGGTNVNVQCYGIAGVPLRSEVALAYSVGEPLGILPGKGTLAGAWAFANDLTSTEVYTPNLKDQFNGFGTGRLTAQKTSTGLYTVTIPGNLTYTTSVALVTAVGDGNAYCNLAGWTNSAIKVACYGTGGVPADSRFEVTFQTAKP